MANSKLEKNVSLHNNDQIDEHTGLHICAKGFCDRSSSFEIIEKNACRCYDEQDSS
jgi:hypothetical protein